MTNEMRRDLEDLINDAWDLYDQAQTESEKQVYTLEAMELLSQLPENAAILKIMQQEFYV